MSTIRDIRFKRGLKARLVYVGLAPGEPAAVWDDPAKPRLVVGDRDGIPQEVLGAAHSHPGADLDLSEPITTNGQHQQGPLFIQVHAFASEVTLDASMSLVVIDSAQTVPVHLPPASTVQGIVYRIKAVGGGNVGIYPNGGDTIDRVAGAFVLYGKNQLTLVAESSGWLIF